MKYLQLFELNTSTYLSAADKLKDQHPKRAELIRKWAQHRSEIIADRIFIHKFKIDLDPVEEFEITDCRIGTGLWNRRSIEICLSSHITNVILDIRWEPIPDNADDFMGRRDIWVQTEVGVMSLWKWFLNLNEIQLKNRERDKKKEKYLSDNNIKSLFLWENEIYKYRENIGKIIIDKINEKY